MFVFHLMRVIYENLADRGWSRVGGRTGPTKIFINRPTSHSLVSRSGWTIPKWRLKNQLTVSISNKDMSTAKPSRRKFYLMQTHKYVAPIKTYNGQPFSRITAHFRIFIFIGKEMCCSVSSYCKSCTRVSNCLHHINLTQPWWLITFM